jgi:serine/threonine-protein kinase RsbW
MRQGVEADAAMETVHIRMPAKAEYVSVARLTAAAVAARHGFTYDEIEDLKIAVSEACTAAIAARTAARPLALRFVPAEGGLEIWVQSGRLGVPAFNSPGARADEPALGLFLMRCLVDDVRFVDEGDGAAAVRLLKRRQEGSDGSDRGAPSTA